MSDPITPFGQTLRNWMWKQEPSWSGRKLALALGVGTGTVWNWLHTEKLPQENMLPKIAKVTGISVNYLYELCGYRSPHIFQVTNLRVLDYMIAAAQDEEADMGLTESERRELVTRLSEIREQFKASGNRDLPEIWIRSGS